MQLMKYECDNCGNRVSRKYYKVFVARGGLKACPRCGGRGNDYTKWGG